ncbi:glycoside hydrolase family 16 protein [Dothidotthia symphoricarpi CBS 119687]|uniref:endo-1,3(4)-beta-glucanase n=1 Tax=Dothidotthia symphoricarpi CBS 119687 TaxID=1392245 RepID=A0A6A6APH0_9PLEO|nr:glycoside hydrolase family 16 protein [Dothidotthia symphoricarpi CBS 119687]KAF2132935.1 glycoside hydrolase family 16 protein [Dothidotthia symphoricarpi CBS 119687]
MRFSTLVSAAAFFELSIAGYVLEDDYMTDFYGAFDFFTDEDPTSGFVKYVDEATARQTNLINSSTTSTVQWGVDNENVTPDGRPSMRLNSKKTYTHGLVVIDVAHMPFGCGTWPAFWMVGPDWPNSGEIDILEGVNDQTNNGVTLHTGPGCRVSANEALFAGDVTTSNCDVDADDQDKNVGCSIQDQSSSSYGAGLNAINGGVYATEWTSDAISVYFFPRGSIPEDVLGDAPDPSGWGKPTAMFSAGCDIAETFKDHQIVFDTTFCGDWAGVDWDKGSCGKKAATCDDYVKNNPEAFVDAHWTVNALKVYKASGDDSTPEVPTSSSASAAISVSVPVPTSVSVSAVPTPTSKSTLSGKPHHSKTTAVVPVPSSKTVSKVPTPTSKTASQATTSSSKASSDIPAPTSESISAVPVPTSKASAEVPIATSEASSELPASTSKAVPLPTTTPATPVAPTDSADNTHVATVPADGMSGFQWPTAGLDSPATPTTLASVSASAAPPASTETPTPSSATPSSAALSSTTPLTTPSPAQTTPQPSSAQEIAEALVPSGVHIVYETVYVTVPAAAGATGSPASKARMRRHIKEQRRSFARHHGRS